MCQNFTILDGGVVIEQDVALAPGLNLVQFGNQNTAEFSQMQSFSSQLSLYQEGDFNFAQTLQFGSGSLSIIQDGTLNRISSFVAGENMDIELYQLGQENEVRQLSIGNNSTYQFIQLGIENSINHLNFRSVVYPF